MPAWSGAISLFCLIWEFCWCVLRAFRYRRPGRSALKTRRWFHEPRTATVSCGIFYDGHILARFCAGAATPNRPAAAGRTFGYRPALSLDAAGDGPAGRADLPRQRMFLLPHAAGASQRLRDGCRARLGRASWRSAERECGLSLRPARDAWHPTRRPRSRQHRSTPARCNVAVETFVQPPADYSQLRHAALPFSLRETAIEIGRTTGPGRSAFGQCSAGGIRGCSDRRRARAGGLFAEPAFGGDTF